MAWEVLRTSAGPLLITAVAGVLILRSWLKWPDVLVDFGQQLYVAWRLAQGEVLYRDIVYFHGPLSAYLHAGVMRLWGESLLALVFFNLLVLATLIVLLYRLLGNLSDRLAASAACLAFVTMFAFAQYLRLGNYNYVCPYTYEITHGVTLALGSLYALVRFTRNAGRRSLALAGFLLGMVFLTKAEVFIAAALASAAGLAVTAWRDRVGIRRAGNLFLILGFAAALAPLLAFALLCLAVTPGDAWRGIMTAYAALSAEGTGELLFYRTRMGIDAPVVNLRRLLLTAGWHLAMLGPAALAGVFRPGAGKAAPFLFAFAFLPIAFSAWHLGSPAWLQAARPLPVLMAVLAVASVIAVGRERRGKKTSPGSYAGVFTLAVFALALLFKIGLSSRIYHYGFVLAMPATLLLVVVWIYWLPSWIEQRGGDGGLLKIAALALLAVTMMAHLRVTDARHREKTHLVGTGGDTFWTDPRGQAVDAVVDYLRQAGSPTLLVVPDGIMLSYLARAPSTAPYLNYVPTEVFAYGEERILEDWKKRPADFVAIVEKSTAEFGYRYFGQDYARDLFAFIHETYETVGLVGAEPLRGQGFGIKIMRRPYGETSREVRGHGNRSSGEERSRALR